MLSSCGAVALWFARYALSRCGCPLRAVALSRCKTSRQRDNTALCWHRAVCSGDPLVVHGRLLTLAAKEKQRRRAEATTAANAVRQSQADDKAARDRAAKEGRAKEAAERKKAREEQNALWTPELQGNLEEALRRHPAPVSGTAASTKAQKKARWANIAAAVGGGMTKKQCAARYAFVRRELLFKRATEEAAAREREETLAGMTPTERAKMARDQARKKEKERRRDVQRAKGAKKAGFGGQFGALPPETDF